MATPSDKLQTLEHRRSQVREQLAAVGDMRPGSLVGRFRRCGKPTCHCAEEGAQSHGPSYSLTREVGGKTITRVIASEAVTRTQEQIAEHRRFRGLARELLEINERVCDAKLDTLVLPTDEAGEKRGSSRPSRRRLSPKSKR